MLCVGCTPAPVAPPPVIVYSACSKVSYCSMPGSDPATKGDLSVDIRRLEHALAACALQVETVNDGQDKLDEESMQSVRSAD
ncbi:Rz1-like lysis system protein LysC [Enterobacter mori]|uniref:Rz1-like lysis system protein LysC n=1 Tax=Enterobacter mori TaxID=539813 RepID=UPI003D2351C7